ncbi:tetratricopeptide repeat protein [Muricoccus radiodurans]|uniref:tetratricopeptide repeat protein n=1 Tax=Muricoccus radiodurans TaxID=2231721 RepID=UPI003CE6F653
MTIPPHQTASVGGIGNTVVQIVGDSNAVTFAGATAALRLRGYGEAAFSAAPATTGRRGDPGYTATGRRETRLLSPYNTASLPLQGRTDLLGGLQGWLNTGESLSIQALVGAGGRGKTRLAVELASWARERGWTAGFARREDLDIFLRGGCRTEWDAPTLVVVDYAAAKSRAVASWLRNLVHDAERAPADAPLRLLLLERMGEGAAWWREVFSGADLEADSVRDHLTRGAPLTLGPLARPEERHAVFAAAFGQASETPVPAPSAILDETLARASLGGEPLFLAMFGLIAARQGLGAAQALPADQIAFDLAGQELDRIGRVWAARGLRLDAGDERPLHAHLAAVVALCEGLDEVGAHDTIERESRALHQAIAPGTTEAARAALYAALPREAGGIAAIQPDILAEAAMILAWKGLPDAGVEVVRRAATNPARRDAVRRSVIRACQDFLIRGQRQPLAWLDALQADAADLQSLLSLSDAMPTATLELRETALELVERIIEIVRALPGWEGRDAFLATSLNNLSVRLSHLGQREAALQASEEATSTNRQLAAANLNAFLPELATSLNNLSAHLSALGRREDALQASEEAVAIRRRLAVAYPDAFLPELATSLHNLSSCLAALGRREDALQASEEAVAIRRQLAAARPDTFLPDLAQSLINLSSCLTDLGRREEALQTIEAAVSAHRQLAAARPDAFLPDLATSLNNLSNCLAALGRRECALQASEEAVAIRRQLAAARPDTFLPDLATSLHNLSICFADLGRREDALEVSEEALAIRRQLAAAHPDTYLPDLATSYNTLSNCLADLGRREDALQASEEAVATHRQLAATRPDAFLHELAGSVDTLSNRLSALGRREDALQASEEAVSAYRQLAATHPDAFLPDLAISLNNLSVHLSAIGWREGALQTSAEAVAIRRQLAAARPDAFLPHLASSLNNLSGCLRSLGHREDALQASEEAVSTYRQLAAARPDAFLPNLGSSCGMRGQILLGLDDQAAARSFAEGITALRDPFLTLPAAFAPLMQALCQGYIGACEASDAQPNMELLAPIIAGLQQPTVQETEMDSKLVEIALGAVVGTLTKAAAEPALSAGRKVWDWAKTKLTGPQATMATALEQAPEDPGTPDGISSLLKSILHRDPAAVEELKKLLGGDAGITTVTQTANVSGVSNTVAQISGSGNTVTGGP